MSTDLTTRLRERLAPPKLYELCLPGEHCGQANENARLKSLHEAMLKVIEAAQGMQAQCDFASEILTLTHPELSNVEMNTLTARQYMIWSRSAKSDAVERYRQALAELERAL